MIVGRPAVSPWCYSTRRAGRSVRRCQCVLVLRRSARREIRHRPCLGRSERSRLRPDTTVRRVAPVLMARTPGSRRVPADCSVESGAGLAARPRRPTAMSALDRPACRRPAPHRWRGHSAVGDLLAEHMAGGQRDGVAAGLRNAPIPGGRDGSEARREARPAPAERLHDGRRSRLQRSKPGRSPVRSTHAGSSSGTGPG